MYFSQDDLDRMWRNINPVENIDLSRLLPVEHIELSKVLGINQLTQDDLSRLLGADQQVKQLIDQVSAPAVSYWDRFTQIPLGAEDALRSLQTAILPSASAVLFNTLPSIARINEAVFGLTDVLIAKDAEGKDILDRGGHQYAADAVATYIVTELAGTTDDELPAQLTSLLYTVSTSSWFISDIESHLSASKLSEGRWPIVKRGIELHESGDFIGAIPTLLPQMEGLLADALIIRSEAERDGSKLYLLDPQTGARVKTKDGKSDRTFSGLYDLVDHSAYKNSAELKNARDYVANFLYKERNGILHGSDTGYASQDRSVRIVLLVSAFAEGIARAEAGKDI